MQEVAGERGGYLHGRGALDSDDLLYLKEQMEAEEDAERLLRRTEKRAFAAFKISYFEYFLQQDLLKKVVEVKPKRPKISSPSSSEPEGNQSNLQSQGQESNHEKKIGHCVSESNTAEKQNKVEKSTKSLLGLAYAKVTHAQHVRETTMNPKYESD
ncbi:hypothetical protein GOBAR_AA01190 [Gossypium barbadense]|uniref:Uncharacterized protein n=1 Tax=Gossypium barbadense TaxID=3634 RepID=A0A2P5YUW1_GOSBA|nr:hypothetical protein GOBAR_AA01190 [Gossypium barbadense]